jgi:ribosomal protein S18 acetylase RimI-like enzyme
VKIRVRPATSADRAAVVALAERLADFDLPPGRTAREIAEADNHLFDAEFAAPSPDVLFLVAEVDSVAVGTLFANIREDYFTGAPYAYIEVLAVAEAAAGKGIARELMRAVEGWAAARSLVRVELAVFANNRRARGFYEHLGYREEIVKYVKPVSGER